MKNTKITIVLAMVGMISIAAFSQPLPEVIGLTKIKFIEGTSEIDYANAIRELNLGLLEHGKGISMMLMYGDRGERKNEYLQAWGFELKANRDYYFPTADATSYPKLGALLEEIGTVGPNDSQLEGERVYTDYVCLGYHEMLNPRAGEIIAMREIEIVAGKEEAFEEFVLESYQPEYQKFIDGMYAYVYKGDRGERKDKYLLVYTFETREIRDKYYPVEGEGAAEAMSETAQGMADVAGTLGGFFDDPSSTSYTDYILIK